MSLEMVLCNFIIRFKIKGGFWLFFCPLLISQTTVTELVSARGSAASNYKFKLQCKEGQTYYIKNYNNFFYVSVCLKVILKLRDSFYHLYFT